MSMLNVHAISGNSKLAAYGRPIFAYEGHGTVQWGDGTSKDLLFEAGQFESARIIVVGRYRADDELLFGGGADRVEPVSFRGQTSTGAMLQSIGPVPVKLSVAGSAVDATIVPVDDVEYLHRRVMTDKSRAVLAEVVVPNAAAYIDELHAAIADLCVVLSVMRGTKVNWIYRADWHDSLQLRMIHRANITKAYSPLAPIDPGYTGSQSSAAFLETALPALSASAIPNADRSVVDAYLDAKVEHDFLETRAAKLALALEKLKHVCLQSGSLAVGEFLIDESSFEKFVPSIVEAALDILRTGGVPRRPQGVSCPKGRFKDSIERPSER